MLQQVVPYLRHTGDGADAVASAALDPLRKDRASLPEPVVSAPTGLPRDHFDVVHCRLLLCHLVRPLDALREMAAIARPGGLVIGFDLDLTGLFSVPATDCYVRLQALLTRYDRLRGIDKSALHQFDGRLRVVGPHLFDRRPVCRLGEGRIVVLTGLLPRPTICHLVEQLAHEPERVNGVVMLAGREMEQLAPEVRVPGDFQR